MPKAFRITPGPFPYHWPVIALAAATNLRIFGVVSRRLTSVHQPLFGQPPNHIKVVPTTLENAILSLAYFGLKRLPAVIERYRPPFPSR